MVLMTVFDFYLRPFFQIFVLNSTLHRNGARCEWVMLGLATYVLSLRLGATRFYALAATSLVLSVPMLLNHVNTLHIDLPVATFFTVGLCVAVVYSQTRSPHDLALFWASVGMLAGIKTPGVIYGGLLIVVVLVLERCNITNSRLAQPKSADFQHRLNKVRTSLWVWKHPLTWLGMGMCLFLGGFWYIHNAFELSAYAANYSATPISSLSANPLSNVSFLEKVWMQISALQASTLTNQFALTDFSHWQTFGIQILLRLQLPFLCLFLPLFLLPQVLVKRHSGRLRLIGLVVLLVGTVGLYWNTPYTGQVYNGIMSPLVGFNLRYGFPILGVLGVVIAVVATMLRLPKRWVLLVCLLSSFSGMTSNFVFDMVKNKSFTGDRIIWAGQLIDTFKETPLQAAKLTFQLLGSDLLSLVGYMLFYIGSVVMIYVILMLRRDKSEAFQRFRNFLKPSLRAGLCIVLLIFITGTLQHSRQLRRDDIYRGIYRYIGENTQPNDKIAYFSSSRNYLFYGDRLNRQVLHIPLDIEQPSQWLETLRKEKVALVGTGPLLGQKSSDAIAQLNQDQPSLVLAFGDDANQSTVLYRVLSK